MTQEKQIQLSGTGELHDPLYGTKKDEEQAFLFLAAIFRVLKAGRKNCYFNFTGQIYFLNFAGSNDNNLLMKLDGEKLIQAENEIGILLKNNITAWLDIFANS